MSENVRKVNTLHWMAKHAMDLVYNVENTPVVFSDMMGVELPFLNLMLKPLGYVLLISANRFGSLKWFRLNSVPIDWQIVEGCFAIIKLH